MLDFARIDLDDLLNQFPYLRVLERPGWNWEDLGASLNLTLQDAGPRKAANREKLGLKVDPKPYWPAVKANLRVLLFTNEVEFQELRAAIAQKGEDGNAVELVEALADWVVSRIGGAPAVIEPLVATVLYGLAEGGQLD